MDVIPAVLEHSLEDVQERVKLLKPHTNFIQLDVMDGAFVPNTTYAVPAEIAKLDIEMEVHLMINKPELFVPQWNLPNVKRIIVHYEAAANIVNLVSQIKKLGKQAAVAINPDTPAHALDEVIGELDMVLVMGVVPGFSGQEFHKDVLEKIRELRSMRADLYIAVDGGVNDKTRDAIEAAGTNAVGANSFLWKGESLEAAMRLLAEGK